MPRELEITVELPINSWDVLCAAFEDITLTELRMLQKSIDTRDARQRARAIMPPPTGGEIKFVFETKKTIARRVFFWKTVVVKISDEIPESNQPITDWPEFRNRHVGRVQLAGGKGATLELTRITRVDKPIKRPTDFIRPVKPPGRCISVNAAIEVEEEGDFVAALHFLMGRLHSLWASQLKWALRGKLFPHPKSATPAIYNALFLPPESAGSSTIICRDKTNGITAYAIEYKTHGLVVAQDAIMISAGGKKAAHGWSAAVVTMDDLAALLDTQILVIYEYEEAAGKNQIHYAALPTITNPVVLPSFDEAAKHTARFVKEYGKEFGLTEKPHWLFGTTPPAGLGKSKEGIIVEQWAKEHRFYKIKACAEWTVDVAFRNGRYWTISSIMGRQREILWESPVSEISPASAIDISPDPAMLPPSGIVECRIGPGIKMQPILGRPDKHRPQAERLIVNIILLSRAEGFLEAALAGKPYGFFQKTNLGSDFRRTITAQLRRLVSNLSTGANRILDMGCGRGTYSTIVFPGKKLAIGLDCDISGLIELNERMWETVPKGMAPTHKIFYGSFEHPGTLLSLNALEYNNLDLIICIMALHYAGPKLAVAVELGCRLLAPNGTFLVVSWDYDKIAAECKGDTPLVLGADYISFRSPKNKTIEALVGYTDEWRVEPQLLRVDLEAAVEAKGGKIANCATLSSRMPGAPLGKNINALSEEKIRNVAKYIILYYIKHASHIGGRRY